MINKKMTLGINSISAFCARFLLSFAILFLLFDGVSAQGSTVEKLENVEEKNISVEFVTDGCTGFPDGNYLDCCVQHDREYFAGGNWKQRWRSDKKLFLCIASKPKFYNKFVAPIAWLGVRVGGVSWLNASFSWGFSNNKSYLKKLAKMKKLPAKNTK